MSRINENPLFQERQKRKLAEERRTQEAATLNTRAQLFEDLVAALSTRGITLKNVPEIVDELIDKGWTKKAFQKRKWNK